MIEALRTAPVALATSTAASPDAGLRDAAQAFEGYLVGALLRLGAQPLDPDDPLVGGSGSTLYRELFYDEVARLAAARGDFGVARMLDASAAGQGDERREPVDEEPGGE